MMACLGLNLFGKNQYEAEPKSITVRPEDTIRELRSHIDRQEKRDRFLDHKCEQLAKEAKQKLAIGNKRAALSLMKQRKLYQAEQVKICNMKMTLETQCISLESAASTAEAYQAMTIGNNTMKKLRTDVGGVENIDELMMDIQEDMQMGEEINNAIGQPLDMNVNMTDDDLLSELEELEGMDLHAQFNAAEMGKPSTKVSMPKVPTSRMSNNNDEEEALKRLQAELAM